MGGGIAPARVVKDPLLAKGFVLLGGEKPLVLLALDWCEIRGSSFDKWKQTQVFQPTGEQANQLNAVHREIFGRNLPNCSTCVTEALHSLLIWANQQQDALTKAQLADDEQKPKRRRKNESND